MEIIRCSVKEVDGSSEECRGMMDRVRAMAEKERQAVSQEVHGGWMEAERVIAEKEAWDMPCVMKTMLRDAVRSRNPEILELVLKSGLITGHDGLVGRLSDVVRSITGGTPIAERMAWE